MSVVYKTKNTLHFQVRGIGYAHYKMGLSLSFTSS